MAATNSFQQLASQLSARVKTLVNADLRRICKEEGQVQSGNKPILQGRVIELVSKAIMDNDTETIQRLRHRIQNHGAPPPSDSHSPSTPSYTHTSPAASNGYDHRPQYAPFQQPSLFAPRLKHQFKESPFFEIRELILENEVLEASPSHRQNFNKNLILSSETCARLKSDPTLRLLLFSALDQPLAPFSRLDVTFPSQIEVRLNGEEVKANYKGLKNKPGSTRPADITPFVRLNPANYRNNLLITYALTQKASQKEKYNVFVYMVKKSSVEDLAKRIEKRNIITKQSVLNELAKKASDPDIVVASSVMSLKDPISTLRIAIPCRSTVCTHNQCFDAESFLQLQEQAPTWTCPICNKTISFEGLAVDQYVQEILDSVPKGTDQVTIEPSGRWIHDKEIPTPRNNGQNGVNGYHAAGDDSDDDLVEISDYRISAIKSEAVHTPMSLARTPPLSSREASAAPRTSNKRTSEVIDLTLDDDEPARPTKKVAYSTPNNVPDPSSRYQLPMAGTSSVPMRPPAPGYPPSSHIHSSYGSHHQPPPRPNYGTSAYPAYLDSSP
ncbi:PINIT domain-containing protein [Massariosphaeria phaeospora]|uniref:PINIT domain-containing protein n=1 Tax=Massariosphaeria phaeospora TaxID=100035 RepID=A0A7C8MD90_9PLEO|nr:PINIT domain-containing protein [Massariosphaeria phaeospora]